MNGTFLARFDKDGNILSTQGYQGQNEQVVGKVIQMFNDVVADGEATFKKAQGFKDELFDVWAVVNNFPQVVEVLKSKGLTPKVRQKTAEEIQTENNELLAKLTATVKSLADEVRILKTAGAKPAKGE